MLLLLIVSGHSKHVQCMLILHAHAKMNLFNYFHINKCLKME